VSLYDPIWDAEIDSDGARLRATRLAAHAGAKRLAANLYEIEQGAMVSPLHFHHANEELLFVIAGTPTVRTSSDEETTLNEGAVIAFPPGPTGTHQILNRAARPARVLICATNELPEVAEQPETGTLAIITDDGLRLLPNAATIDAP
jgi:uncharacterized cupin superfamily protein